MNANKIEELVSFIMTRKNIIKHIANKVASGMSRNEIVVALPLKKFKSSFSKGIQWDFRMVRLTDKQEELQQLESKMRSRNALTRVWTEEMSDVNKTKFLKNLSEDMLRKIGDSYQSKMRTNDMDVKYEKLKREVKAEKEKLEKEWVERYKKRLEEQEKATKKV
jgi:hypothetical protein